MNGAMKKWWANKMESKRLNTENKDHSVKVNPNLSLNMKAKKKNGENFGKPIKRGKSKSIITQN